MTTEAALVTRPMIDPQQSNKTPLSKQKTRLSSLFRFKLTQSVWVLLLLSSLSFNSVTANESPFTVKGFDASHHQGQIDWKKISPQQYQFVYLKATEGGDYVDPRFQDYWLEARERGLNVGAYHFYNLCRDAETQSRNFIHTVPIKVNALPPVIDLEYDSTCIAKTTKEQLLKQIKIMHDRLYTHYGKAPIFYTTPNFYHMILAGNFNQTPLWIRDYQGQPQLKGRHWTFWQYSRQGKINGINGPVDLNVFYADQTAWQKFIHGN